MEQEKSLDPQLWHAFAGSTVQIPSLNSTVFYFPQGHLEHAQAPIDFHAPRVPPLILCRVVALKFLAGADTDDVYAKITLLPLPDDAVVSSIPPGGNGSEKPVFFTKTLTHTDTNDGGGFSVPRRCAETVFPRLDYTAKSPVQTIIAKDIHGETWKFRHTFSGTPRRHFLTTGWSTFVERKNLIAGDSVVFFRSETGDLFVGVRRVKRWPYPWISNFIRGDVNTVERVTVEAVAEAVACGQPFEVVYYPGANTPEFCVKGADVRAAMRIRWCSGMRYKMAFELDGFSGISWFTGTVSAVEVADPIRWPDSPWRLLQVTWDEPGLLQKVKRVNPWLVELVSEMPATSIRISPKKKLRTQPPFDGITTVAGDWEWEDSQEKLNKYLPPTWECEKVESEKSSSKQAMEKDEELAGIVAESLRDAKFSTSTDKDEELAPTVAESLRVSGISSVAGDDDNETTVTDNLQDVLWKVNKYESEKSRSKQHMDEDEELALAVANSLSDAKFSRPTDSGSGSTITKVAGKPTNIPSNMRNQSYPNEEWDSFCEFLANRVPPLNPSVCRAEDIIEFVCKQQASADVETLVGRLSAACEVLGIKPQDNPFFHIAAVTAYLKAAKGMPREEVMGKSLVSDLIDKENEETVDKLIFSTCILVFLCSDNDLDEVLFIDSISRKLQERGVTPLTYSLSRRKNIDLEILHRSSVGIMVLSNSYACSRESMDHLVAIMEHWKAKDCVIIPIYFKVTLSDICGLEGRFKSAFLQYMNSVQPGIVQKWKATLAEIASIDGHEWTKETQVMVAEEVVSSACLRLYLKNSKNLVRILPLLNHSHPSDADIVGIWGMAGIGKTSIAREIFGTLAPRYDLCYFLQDFYLRCQMKGLRQMRDDFYSKVFGEEKLSIGASDVKPSFMRNLFHKKTILVVLDDVSNARDVEAVVGGFGWFSHGHRIILTSRRKQVLVQCKVKEPYEIQKLSEFESFRLCKLYLNGESGVISELMSCSSGIPLVLKVLGSTLSKKHINDMKEHLQRLRRNPPTQIQETFRRSFDGLNENEKNIFLDLACFFKGENIDHVVQILDACGFLTYLGICDLIDESLISLMDNKIEIPIPFQDMGRFIVHEEDDDPCERSRLWDSNDITNVLKNNSGTEAIEGIFLDASDLTCELSPTVFSEMHRLRLLKLYCSTSGNECKLKLPQGLDTLPDELRLLHWEYYPLKYLPQEFNPENLVEVNMPYSKMERLWQGQKNLGKLKKIKLSHSRNLTDIMMLSEALNLEHIDLEGCKRLVDVSTSIPPSGKLVSLNMKDCSDLRTLPAMVGLTSLKLLNLSGCSELEEIQDFAPNLKELNLAGTAIRELPLSIENLTELVTLDLENCRRLQHLPFGIRNSRSILELKLSGCTSLKSLSNFEALV